MRVRILSDRCGRPSGSVVEVDDAVAAVWLGHGEAERVVDDAVRQPRAERATAEPAGETAVSEPRRSWRWRQR